MSRARTSLFWESQVFPIAATSVDGNRAAANICRHNDNMSCPGNDDDHDRVLDTFAKWHPLLVDEALGDFSGLCHGSTPFCQIAPRKIDSISEIVKTAGEHNVGIRLRAQGHSLNGATLPNAGELLLSSSSIRHVRFEEPGTVTVGSGVVLWILQSILRRVGFDVPVLNDGYPGPTVGGYISAGGFGPRSAVYGGFWDNVSSIRLLDGRGELRVIKARDELFPWLFGSMGQLGVLFDAKLSIVPSVQTNEPEYPAGKTLVAPQLVGPAVPPEFAVDEDQSLFWFTLLVPDEYIGEAHRDLHELERGNRRALRFQERYSYPIRFRGEPSPPLFYPDGRGLTATGAWGWLTEGSDQGVSQLKEFDRSFLELACSNSHYRRYVQCELPSGPATYQRCFGPQTYTTFRKLKAQLDPDNLFNSGSVFSATGETNS